MKTEDEIYCDYCDSNFVIISNGEDDIQYCPFCGTELVLETIDEEYIDE